jgi:DNA-binding transcriptional LysR family regulator
MDLDQLRSFLAVAQAGGFSRAAVAVHSTQPTLSRQVQALEHELGRRLFDRLGRHIELTAFGRDVAARAQAILAQADALASTTRSPAAQVSGVLRLGLADSVVLGRFPQILKRFSARNPAVREQVRTATTPDILRWVKDGACDAGLCMLPGAHPGLVLRELWTDRFVAIVPAGHPLAGRAAKLSRFAAERQIALPAESLSYQVINAAFTAIGQPLLPDLTFDNFHLIVEFVAAGVGAGVVSLEVARPALGRRRVARVRVTEIDRLTRRLGLVLHAGRAVDPPLAAFVDLLTAGGKRAERDATPQRL